MRISSTALLVAPFLMSGCIETSPVKRVPPTVCATGDAQNLVGTNIGEVWLDQRLEVLQLTPGDPLPNHRRPGRLVLTLDAKGWIAEAACE